MARSLRGSCRINPLKGQNPEWHILSDNSTLVLRVAYSLCACSGDISDILFSTWRQQWKVRKIKTRNLSLLCSPLATTEYNSSVALQLQLCSLKHVIKTWKPSDSVYSIRGWKRRWSYSLEQWNRSWMCGVRGPNSESGGPPALCRTKRKWDLLLCFLNAFFYIFFYDFLELVCHFSFLLRSGLGPEEEPGSISIHLFSSWICKNKFLTNSSTLKNSQAPRLSNAWDVAC